MYYSYSIKKKKLLLELIFNFSQIENEYGNMESSYGQQGKDYVKWAASMALGLGAGVPWVMCKQTDAPENIVKSLLNYLCNYLPSNAYTC